MNTVTFTVNGDSGEVTFSVTKEFVKNHPDYLNKNITQLFQESSIYEYLHNDNGPAIIQSFLDEDDEDKYVYALNGKCLLNEEKEAFIKQLKENNETQSK